MVVLRHLQEICLRHSTLSGLAALLRILSTWKLPCLNSFRLELFPSIEPEPIMLVPSDRVAGVDDASFLILFLQGHGLNLRHLSLDAASVFPMWTHEMLSLCANLRSIKLSYAPAPEYWPRLINLETITNVSLYAWSHMETPLTWLHNLKNASPGRFPKLKYADLDLYREQPPRSFVTF